MPGARPAVDGNRGPWRVVCSADGRRVYVAEAEEATVAELEAATGAVLRRLPTGGEQPNGLALTPDGRTLVVANTFSGSVARIGLRPDDPPPTTGQPARSGPPIPLPGMPWGVAVSPDGEIAYVSVSQLDVVAVIDLGTAREVGRIPVGRRPQALALTPDGATLVCANMTGGTLSIVDTKARRELKQVPLRGVNARGVALAAADSAFVTVQPPLNFRPANFTLEVWNNFVREVRLAGAASEAGEEQWLDFGAIGSPEMDGLAISPDGRYAYAAVTGRHSAAQITIHDARRNTIWPFSFKETPVGAAPRGLALSPDGKRLWVANWLGNSVTLLDAPSMTVLRTISLGPASRVDPATYGRFLFHSASLGRDGRFSCASCHPDGMADGLTWEFTHVGDGLDRRNTRDLRAGIAATAPFRWTGHDPDLGDFAQEEVTGLLQGPRLAPPELAALGAALASFRLPPNPYRGASGELTPGGRRGEALFTGKAQCGTCHAGPRLGGTGQKAWIGTTPAGLTLDVPHLVGVYDSAPYLHDGRAASLEAIFTEHNAGQLHGRAHLLTDAERGDLLQYLREQ
jgi:YVTN family beta-propeller protein